MKLNKSLFYLAAVYTGSGAITFAVPESPMAKLAQIPAGVSPFHAYLLAYLLLLFAFIYLWMAQSKTIIRELLLLCAAGKLGAFILALVLFTRGDIHAMLMLFMIPDGLFSAYWA